MCCDALSLATLHHMSNYLFGFFWWFHMWGHSIIDPLFENIGEEISIWGDLEEMIGQLPWYFGLIFWIAPVLFFSIVFGLSFYAVVFAGFWFWGIVAMLVSKLLGSGWIRYAPSVVGASFDDIEWYQKKTVALSASKKAGLKSFKSTAVAKIITKTYNKIMQSIGMQITNVKVKIEQWHEEHK